MLLLMLTLDSPGKLGCISFRVLKLVWYFPSDFNFGNSLFRMRVANLLHKADNAGADSVAAWKSVKVEDLEFDSGKGTGNFQGELHSPIKYSVAILRAHVSVRLLLSQWASPTIRVLLHLYEQIDRCWLKIAIKCK